MHAKQDVIDDPIARWISEALLDDETTGSTEVTVEDQPDASVLSEDAKAGAFLDHAERFLRGRADALNLISALAARFGAGVPDVAVTEAEGSPDPTPDETPVDEAEEPAAANDSPPSEDGESPAP